jgi:hypothetical protein
MTGPASLGACLRATAERRCTDRQPFITLARTHHQQRQPDQLHVVLAEQGRHGPVHLAAGRRRRPARAVDRFGGICVHEGETPSGALMLHRHPVDPAAPDSGGSDYFLL